MILQEGSHAALTVYGAKDRRGLQEAATGDAVKEVCRKCGIPDPTFLLVWRRKRWNHYKAEPRYLANPSIPPPRKHKGAVPSASRVFSRDTRSSAITARRNARS